MCVFKISKIKAAHLGNQASRIVRQKYIQAPRFQVSIQAVRLSGLPTRCSKISIVNQKQLSIPLGSISIRKCLLPRSHAPIHSPPDRIKPVLILAFALNGREWETGCGDHNIIALCIIDL